VGTRAATKISGSEIGRLSKRRLTEVAPDHLYVTEGIFFAVRVKVQHQIIRIEAVTPIAMDVASLPDLLLPDEPGLWCYVQYVLWS
jgi:hypothetical protein